MSCSSRPSEPSGFNGSPHCSRAFRPDPEIGKMLFICCLDIRHLDRQEKESAFELCGERGCWVCRKQGVLHSHWLNRRTDSIGSEWPLLDCQVQGGSVAMRLSKAAHLPLEDTREQQHASWPAGHDTRYCRWYCGVLPAPCPSDESAQRRVGEKGRRGKPEAALALGHIHSFHCIRTHASV